MSTEPCFGSSGHAAGECPWCDETAFDAHAKEKPIGSLRAFLRRLSPCCAECGRWWWSKSGRKFCSLVHTFDREFVPNCDTEGL